MHLVWWTPLLLISSFFVLKSRSDPVEGTRLLEEAFRDYDKRIRPNYSGSPVPVNVSIHILSISEINPMAMTYTITFFFRQIWTDTRLSFNSRRNIDSITLDPITSERVWVPDTFFVNEISLTTRDLLANNQFCRITQNGTILFSKKITLTAFSPMLSDKFPYDSHRIYLELESYGSQTKDLNYQWSPEPISKSRTAHFAPGFLVGATSHVNAPKITSTGSYSRLLITIDVQRNPVPYELGFMMCTFVLSLLCLFSTSSSVSPAHGTLAATYLVSLIAVLYGFPVLGGFQNMGTVRAITILQIYMLVSAAFGFVCILVNLHRRNSSMQLQCSESDACERKSGTESTSDNCKTEELSETQEQSVREKGKCWGNVTHSNCGRKLLPGLETVVRSFLWIVFILMNVLFVTLSRFLP